MRSTFFSSSISRSFVSAKPSPIPQTPTTFATMATPPVQPVPPVVAVAALNADVFRLGFVGAATWPRASPAAWRRRASSQPPPSAPHPTAAPSAARPSRPLAHACLLQTNAQLFPLVIFLLPHLLSGPPLDCSCNITVETHLLREI